MKIAFVVCGNGYGHLKRVCRVTEEIFVSRPDVEIMIAGATHHALMLNTWKYSDKFSGRAFSFVNTKLENNVKATLPSAYTFADYKNSFTDTHTALRAFAPEIVVSDNLAGILNDYPHAMLMGSFLWPDTLRKKYPADPELEKICRYEEELLMKHKPLMFGVEDLVMPYVQTHTRFTGLPWFCEPLTTESKPAFTNKVLITGGGTQNAAERLLGIARALRPSGTYTICLDRSLYAELTTDEQQSFTLFDFSPAAFQSLAWIICRPGLGILTDAVQYAVPLCVVEEDDPEIMFNGHRVEALGVGLCATADSSSLADQLAHAGRNDYIRKLHARKTGGAVLAAHHILNSTPP